MKNRRKAFTDKRQNEWDHIRYNQPADDRSPDVQMAKQERAFWNSLSYGLRSALAIIICLIIPVTWYFDWKPVDAVRQTSKAVIGLFGNTSLPPAPNVEVPPASLPPGPLSDGIVNYLSELSESGMQNQFSMPAVRAFYENRVSIDFLKNLGDANLLEELSFPAIVAFHNNDVPVSYLSRLKVADLLDKFSFPALVSFYQNKVSLTYLNELQDAGFLETFSFPGVVAFYENQIPVTFLQQLKTKNLLNSLSFPDVINLYHSNSSMN